MSEDRQNLDPVEQALIELGASESGRVFARTHVDAQRLVSELDVVAQAAIWRASRRWLPVAAALAVAVGGWAWLYRVETSSVHEGLGDAVVTNSVSRGCDGSFFGCMTGPSQVVVADCGGHDYDGDGDVDLVDSSIYQLRCEGVGR